VATVHKDGACPVDLAELALQLSIPHAQIAQVLIRQVVGRLGFDAGLVNLTHLHRTTTQQPMSRCTRPAAAVGLALLLAVQCVRQTPECVQR
jgi:hypothetical protein